MAAIHMRFLLMPIFGGRTVITAGTGRQDNEDIVPVISGLCPARWSRRGRSRRASPKIGALPRAHPQALPGSGMRDIPIILIISGARGGPLGNEPDGRAASGRRLQETTAAGGPAMG